MASCPIGSSESRSAELWLSALGDFPPDDGAQEPLALDVPSELALPTGLRALEARVEAANFRFWGYSERTSNELPLLLWPRDRACRLDSEALDYPRSGDGQALGFSPETRTLLLSGGNSLLDPSGSVAALTFDAGSGRLEVLEGGIGSGTALSEPRAFASVTAFGSRLLVAGGEDPLVAAERELRALRQTAEVFDPSLGRFIEPRIPLSVARAQHGAVRLASGDTLLVGGRGPRGSALNVLETISPITNRSSIAGLRALEFPRLFPAVLPLDDGRIFVGGGAAADGTPVSAFEWLSSDARTYLDNQIPAELPARHDRALIALPGGGVLIVGGCQPNDSSACRGPCRAGCPPEVSAAASQQGRYDAWWLAPDKSLTALPLDVDAPRPVLAAAADGMPVLASGAPGDTILRRFNPWTERFEEMPAEVFAPPAAGLPLSTLDAGAIAWVAEGETSLMLVGMRLGTRNRFASDPNLVSGMLAEDQTAPFPLVPDRPTAGKVRFESGSGLLVFEADSEARVFVAGTDYAGLSLDLWVEGDAPRIVLGTLEYGGPECPWPAGATTRFRVERRGDEVSLSSGPLEAAACDGPAGRVRLGLFRGAGAMLVRHASIVRQP